MEAVWRVLSTEHADTETGLEFLWSRTIAEKILARATEDDPEAVRRALMISSEGYSEVLDANASGAQTYRELMWCARVRHRPGPFLLSRGDVGDSSYLAQVTFWKNAEGRWRGRWEHRGAALWPRFTPASIALSGGMVETRGCELRLMWSMSCWRNYVDNTEYDAFDLIKFTI
ncbi:hypothetical protein GS894_24080 [Rhodococcus hoagii]|nr:hypothetical protein [Prescottella equi]